MKKLKNLINQYFLKQLPKTEGVFAYKNKSKQPSGFTLIEVLITLVIVGTVMSAATYLMLTVMWATEENKKRLSATYLAQECSELMRNKRDTSWKRFQPWDCADGSNLFSATAPGNEYVINPTVLSNEACGETGKFALDLTLRNEGVNDKIYSHGLIMDHDSSGTAEETIFSRWVEVDGITSDKLDFTCHVKWNTRGTDKEVTISSRLTNWFTP